MDWTLSRRCNTLEKSVRLDIYSMIKIGRSVKILTVPTVSAIRTQLKCRAHFSRGAGSGSAVGRSHSLVTSYKTISSLRCLWVVHWAVLTVYSCKIVKFYGNFSYIPLQNETITLIVGK